MADDVYLQSEVPSNLQHLMDIASKSGKQYRIIYGAAKTKIVVTGSKVDMAYYSETSPWTMDGAKVNVVENNEHLGLIVSGDREEEKNIDARLKKARSSLFSLLGPAFSQKCLLSPVVKRQSSSLQIIYLSYSPLWSVLDDHSTISVHSDRCLPPKNFKVFP